MTSQSPSGSSLLPASNARLPAPRTWLTLVVGDPHNLPFGAAATAHGRQSYPAHLKPRASTCSAHASWIRNAKVVGCGHATEPPYIVIPD